MRFTQKSWAILLLSVSALVWAAYDYSDYLAALSTRESSGNPGVVNQYGYLGEYQMGEAALIDAGYYIKDSTPGINDWTGAWTGKNGINSEADFLANAAKQTQAINDYNHVQWGYIKNLGLDAYLGQTIAGVLITESGLLAGAHLVGAGGLKTFLTSNGTIVPGDANKVAVTGYIGLFNGYNIAPITGHTTPDGMGHVPITVNPSTPITLSGLTPSLGGAYQNFSIAPSSAFQSGTGGVSYSDTLTAVQAIFSTLLLLWMAYVAWGQLRLWSTDMQSLYGMQTTLIKSALMTMLLLFIILS